MGILQRYKSRVGKSLMDTADKSANLIANASEYSSVQLETIEKKRQKFLSEKPDTEPEGIKRLLGSYAIEAFEAYLPQISKLYEPIDIGDANDLDIINRTRYFEITKWVCDPNEDNLDKLINMYQVVGDKECNIALIYHRIMSGCKVYLAVVNKSNQNTPKIANNMEKGLIASLKGNFPGAEIKESSVNTQEHENNTNTQEHYGFGTIPVLEQLDNASIAAVSNIAAAKSDAFGSQSMDKLLDGIIPDSADEEYTIVLLASPIREQMERRNELSELYTRLAPYSQWQTNFTISEMDTQGSSANVGVSLGVSAGIQFGKMHSAGESLSAADSEIKSITSSDTVGGGGEVHIGGKHVGGGISGHYDHSRAVTKGTAVTNTAGTMMQSGNNTGGTLGANFGVQFSRSSNVAVSIGKNEGLVQNYTNFGIRYTLELIEKQIKRLEESAALGMWDFSAYFLSKTAVVADNAAHMYLALTQGNESYMSQSAVNTWIPSDEEGRKQTSNILKFIKRLKHPEFQIKASVDGEWLMYPPHVSTTVTLTGRELARALNFPQRSVCGLPVLQSVAFGREVQEISADGDFQRKCTKISIGNIYHMRHDERNTVGFDINKLTAHTLVTGSTGSGKSNTVYQLLNKLDGCGVKFLVIEPAKGEYKSVFGMENNVNVYGTNQAITPLLRINPFRFPEGIHVFEHLDRLVEIFNVCWPMYAAMPAVLKNAIEKSYADCGWDLAESTNAYGNDLYPTFADVVRNIKDIIDSSEYDAENQGAYKGALLTRLQSLTNGINGMIFTSDEIPAQELFEENVIVDLSRIGSNETKSLIMGMLVLKLSEYRITSANGMNCKLRHLTVLEEAHYLLKRSSAEGASESGNLLGKSVEMIANAIAEMRTYGEGFVIVDQAPGLLDMAAVRNTNTKVIMHLPDQSDRELVGKAANLSDSQITELARLPRGVAAIYQNEWIEPVLCKIDQFDTPQQTYHYERPRATAKENDMEQRIHIVELLSHGIKIDGEAKLQEIRKELVHLGLAASLQVMVIKMLENPPKDPRMTKIAPITNALFPSVTEAVKKSCSESRSASEWTKSAEDAIHLLGAAQIDILVERDIIQCAMIYYFLNELGNETKLKEWTERGGF